MQTVVFHYCSLTILFCKIYPRKSYETAEVIQEIIGYELKWTVFCL